MIFTKRITALITALVLLTSGTQTTFAHGGRRVQVSLDGNAIVAQGVNTSSTSDGAPDLRPYQSAIHDHWANSPLVGSETASANFPEFDILANSTNLADWPLYLTLIQVNKWTAPPINPEMGTVPTLSSLDVGEAITITLDGVTINSNTLDQFDQLTLLPSVPLAGELDISPTYGINTLPSNEIHILEFSITSGNTAIAPSDPLYVLLSPDGATGVERLHLASLYTEQYFGNLNAASVPEPSSAVACLISLGAFALRRRRHERCQRAVR